MSWLETAAANIDGNYYRVDAPADVPQSPADVAWQADARRKLQQQREQQQEAAEGWLGTVANRLFYAVPFTGLTEQRALVNAEHGWAEICDCEPRAQSITGDDRAGWTVEVGHAHRCTAWQG